MGVAWSVQSMWRREGMGGDEEDLRIHSFQFK